MRSRIIIRVAIAALGALAVELVNGALENNEKITERNKEAVRVVVRTIVVAASGLLFLPSRDQQDQSETKA